jgi:hypothetical protein
MIKETIKFLFWSFIYISNCFSQAPIIQWQKCYGGSDYDSFGSVLQLSNGNFVIDGNSASNDFDISGNHGDNDIWITKLIPQ